MSDATHRWITLERLGEGVYLARNPRGGQVRFGSMAGIDFSPVEMLLAALAGCSAVDVDVVTARRCPAESFAARVEAEAVRDSDGNILQDIRLTFSITFPPGEAGDAARDVLPRAVRTSHERTCTVSRTIEAGTPVVIDVAGAGDGGTV